MKLKVHQRSILINKDTGIQPGIELSSICWGLNANVTVIDRECLAVGRKLYLSWSTTLASLGWFHDLGSSSRLEDGLANWIEDLGCIQSLVENIDRSVLSAHHLHLALLASPLHVRIWLG